MSVFVLSACTTKSGVYKELVHDCVADPAQHTANVDWSRAEVVQLRIRQNEFDPITIVLNRDTPYIIRIENADDIKRGFRAAELFREMAVAKIKIGDEDFAETCVNNIIVDGNSTCELHFVAIRDGHYKFDAGLGIFPFQPSTSGFGYVTIQ
jgi:hypothetical protein